MPLTPVDTLTQKNRLVGGCVRLHVGIDAARLRKEVEALHEELWASRAERVGVHRDAGALFLRGFAPAEGERPIEDREALEALPYARELIWKTFGAPPARCLLARLPGAGMIPEHQDLGPYFAKTVRIHIPVVTHAEVFMLCDGLSYVMAPGEAWALNNSSRHGVLNADPVRSRTHLICDYTPTPALWELIGAGERGLGRPDAVVERALIEERARRAALRSAR